MKEEVPLDDTYAILKRVAAGEFVFIDYKNGVGPQIEIKYKRGDKTFIHQASHRWAKFSGINRDGCCVYICSLVSLWFPRGAWE